MASHPVGHSAVASKKRSGRYSPNRSRWPCEQVGMLVASRKNTCRFLLGRRERVQGLINDLPGVVLQAPNPSMIVFNIKMHITSSNRGRVAPRF